MLNDEERAYLANLRDKLPIDRFELERECCDQAITYDEVGSWASEVKATAKIAKEHVSFVESRLSLEIRRNPSKFGITGKPTVDTVVAAVKTHPEYMQAFKDYVEADRLANDAANLLESVAQRKSGIRDLVRLYIHNYYSERDDQVNATDWREGEQAIQEIRTQRALAGEDMAEDRVEEE